MKLQFIVSALPLLAFGQSASQQEFNNLCGSGQTTGTTTLNGEQYTYHCNKRGYTNTSPAVDGHNDPATCAALAAGNSGAVGVTWIRNGKCAVATSGPPTNQSGGIFFEKVVSSGGGACCQERDTCKAQLATCQTQRDQFKAERDTCQAQNSGGSGPVTGGPGTGGPGTGGGRVNDCKHVTGSGGWSGVDQAGHKWSVNCNMRGGAGIIKKPADTAADLPACVDLCAVVPNCKVALFLGPPQKKSNCILYSAQAAYSSAPGDHIAVRS